MNSFTGIFWQRFKFSPHAPPFIDSSPPSNFEDSPPPTRHVLNACGKPFILLTISYLLFFLCISKFSSMLHHGSVEWFHSKERYFSSVRPLSPFYCGGGWGVEPQTKFSKGGPDRTSTFRGNGFFQGGCNFQVKNKLKSVIFNDKNSLWYKQNYFSLS